MSNDFPVPSEPVTTPLGSAGDTDPARKHSEHHRDLGLALTDVLNVTARIVGFTVSGPPTSGIYEAGDVIVDQSGQMWISPAGGSPGTWLAVGSGRVIGGPVVLATNWTMTTAGTEEDVPGYNVSFTYDGRPVRIICQNPGVMQDQNALKIITMKLVRATDNAVQTQGFFSPPASANYLGGILLDTGPITAWKSDSVPFVVGTTYTVKVRITSQSGSKATLNGSTGGHHYLAVYSC